MQINSTFSITLAPLTSLNQVLLQKLTPQLLPNSWQVGALPDMSKVDLVTKSSQRFTEMCQLQALNMNI